MTNFYLCKITKKQQKTDFFYRKNHFFHSKNGKKTDLFCQNHKPLTNNELPTKNVLIVTKNDAKFTMIVPVVTKVVPQIITPWLSAIIILQRQNSPNGESRQNREQDFRFVERKSFEIEVN